MRGRLTNKAQVLLLGKSEMTAPAATPPPKENLLLNLACNVAAPAIILSKFSERLGAKNALIIALACPLAYGLYDLVKRRNFNFLSALGFTSTLATGGLGLLKLEANPRDSSHSKNAPGAHFKCKKRNLTTYGAYIEN